MTQPAPVHLLDNNLISTTCCQYYRYICLAELFEMSEIAEAAEQFVEKMTDAQNAETGDSADREGSAEGEGRKLTMEERKAKMEQLRRKMVRVSHLTVRVWLTPPDAQRTSALENRKSVVEESAKAKITAREAARLERQRKLAETLRLKADAEERGEDVERAKNWDYTIEENDEWEKKLSRKQRRADFEFHSEYLAVSSHVLDALNGVG